MTRYPWIVDNPTQALAAELNTLIAIRNTGTNDSVLCVRTDPLRGEMRVMPTLFIVDVIEEENPT